MARDTSSLALEPQRGSRGTILVISPELPFPPTAGHRIDILGRVRFFVEAGWTVALAVCSRFGDEVRVRAEAWSEPVEVHVVEKKRRFPRVELPETVGGVQALVDRYRPDVVWCDYADFGPLATKLELRGAKLWFRPANFELLHHLEREVGAAAWSSPASVLSSVRWLSGRLARRILSAERRMFRRADHLFFISLRERDLMPRFYGGSTARSWLPPFLTREVVPVKRDKAPLDVVFVASDLNSPKHLAAARKLLDEVVPAIVGARPKRFRFHCVGRGSDRLPDVGSDAVSLHGFVEDLPTFLREMDVACIPGTTGWGCKIKMIEALASGLPCVGAPRSFDGIPRVEGAWFACRNSREYVDAFDALSDPERRQGVGSAGRDAYLGWVREAQDFLRTELAGVTPA